MLEDKIMSDYKEAMKARDTVRSTVLNFLRAEFKNVAIAKKKDVLDDDEAAAIIKKQIKQRQDSIDQFEKGGRKDLAEKEVQEMALLKAYLPAELPLEEVKRIIEEVALATGALSLKDMGRVMKEVNTAIAGRADGKLVSDLVRERLTKGKF